MTPPTTDQPAHVEHGGTIRAAVADENALTRAEMIRCHALTVAGQIKHPGVHDLLADAQTIADWITS